MFRIPDSSDFNFKRAELTRLKHEHGLTGRDLGNIMGCNAIYVFEYLAGRMEIPEHRLRLLKLELGERRPYWTPAKRAKLYERELRKECFG